MKKKILLAVMMILLGVFAFGIVSVSAATSGYLTYFVSDGEVVIDDCDTSVSGELVIPDTINGYPVTSIDSSAFSDCSSLVSVTIPDSVTYIGYYAFEYCSSLVSVTIPDSVTSIGAYAFRDCSSLVSIIVSENNENYTSENGVLFNKDKTELIVYPAGKTDNEYTIPDGVESIDSDAFYNCSSLESIIVSENNENYTSENGVLFNKDKTELIVYPAGKTDNEYTIPDGVESIGSDAFYNCSSLVSIIVSENNENYTSENGVLFNKDKTELIVYPAGKTDNEYTIPDGVTSIGEHAFWGCDRLAITIPNSMTSIGFWEFYNCSGIVSVTIPESVTSIGFGAFQGCTGLTSITIPDSVTSIEGQAFLYCSSLTSITIPDSVTSIGDYSTFSNCTSLTSITIGNGVTSIDSTVFSDCTSLASIAIGNGVKSIGEGAFSDCTSLEKVKITDINAWCNIEFEDCYSNPLYYAKNLYLNGNLVTELVIPDSVTSIGNYAFSNCSSLVSITIPNSVTNIEDYAFCNCSGLKYVCLSGKIKDICFDAFSGCSSIETVIYTGSKEKWNEILFHYGNQSLTEAMIVYNAEKKIYRFETNCDETLKNIIDYAIFTMPTVENNGMVLMGWYDNAALSGEPVTFPYFGDAATLYAAWGARSFDTAYVVKSNQQYAMKTTEKNQILYFEFIPQVSKEYHFYTVGNSDTYGYLYDREEIKIASDDDSGDGNNFYMSYNLTAGKIYYIAVTVYGSAGSFTLVVEEDGTKEYKIEELTIKDKSGKNLSSIPAAEFLASVSFTNVSSSEDTVIVLAQYSSSGEFKGLIYVNTKNMPVGTTIQYTLPVDNKTGDITQLKAFCWESFESAKPVGNSVSFPAE